MVGVFGGELLGDGEAEADAVFGFVGLIEAFEDVF